MNQGVVMGNKRLYSMSSTEKAIRKLLKDTRDDADKVSTLLLGDGRGDEWRDAEGAVFVVRDGEIARKLFLWMESQKLTSMRTCFETEEKA
jgi:hypothetical protein